ncbi:MAG TPA: alpha/beta fold hydrolase [Sulfuricella sp.]|nr:alpha/beta fold hydrolase [Sulfuricella sp.]
MTVLLILAAMAAAFHLSIHIGFRAPRVREQHTPEQYGLPYREVAIPTRNGKRLFGWFIPAPGAGSAPAVAVLHGWGGNAEMLLPLAQPLHQAGYSVLLFDARNHGRSDGDSFSSMPRFAEDMECALDWLAHQPAVDATRLVALGHSVGAGAALLAASRRPSLAAVVSIAAFADPESMMRRFMHACHVPHFPIGRYVLRYVQRVIGHRFSDIAPRNTIRQIRCPVLLVHGSDDGTVPVEDAQTIYDHRSGDHVRLLILAGDHDSFREVERQVVKLTEFLDRATGRKNGA